MLGEVKYYKRKKKEKKREERRLNENTRTINKAISVEKKQCCCFDAGICIFASNRSFACHRTAFRMRASPVIFNPWWVYFRICPPKNNRNAFHWIPMLYLDPWYRNTCHSRSWQPTWRIETYYYFLYFYYSLYSYGFCLWARWRSMIWIFILLRSRVNISSILRRSSSIKLSRGYSKGWRR